MKVSVIISTYNSPRWLEKVLWGYACQDTQEFDIIIADDGSTEETEALVGALRSSMSVDIQHVWHEDRGYRRQAILNKAIGLCKGNYIIMTDGDCIPRKDFVSTHVQNAAKGHFLSGGYCKLPMCLSTEIQPGDIISQDAFRYRWLAERGLKGFSQARKLLMKGRGARWMDALTTAKATFNNCNSSAWKRDLIRINGYDERMKYGGADRELGERLVNAGIRGIQIRHQAIVIHLDHARTYKTDASTAYNASIRKSTRISGSTWTPYGIYQDRNELASETHTMRQT